MIDRLTQQLDKRVETIQGLSKVGPSRHFRRSFDYFIETKSATTVLQWNSLYRPA